jgi:hypothetical protein
MKILELYSGTGSFSRAAEKRGHTVFTIDIDPQFGPSLVKDITKLEKTDIPFIPDVIWCSPPCQEYSHAKRSGVRHFKTADKNVLKCLEVIKWYENPIWIIENPQTGLLKSRPFMRKLNLPFTDVSYCKYGLEYRKQTRLWNNFGFLGKTCQNDCTHMTPGLVRMRHIGSAGCGGQGQGHKIRYTNKAYNRLDKYKIPTPLCSDIIKFIEKIKK